MIISFSLATLGPTIDMVWVGKLGAASMAGVGIAGLAVMVITSLISGLFTGTTAMVARFIGARDEGTSNLVAQQAFVIGIALSVFMAVIGIAFARPILVLLGLEPDVVADGTAYLRIQFIGMVTTNAFAVAQSVMQASGDSVVPMRISVGYRLFHIALCPFLVSGWFFFPRLGVSGAALSSIISQGVGGAIGLWILFSGRTRLTITFRNFRFDPGIIWRTVKIGIPASISMMEVHFSNLILIWFVTPFGTLAVAAHSLAQRIDWMVQMLAAGIGMGSGILAGQNLGAGKPDRAAMTGWLGAGLSTAFTVACSIFVWYRVESLIHIFNTEPELVSIAATFLKIQIVGYVVWGMVVSLSMCLSGTGNTFVPMVVNITTMWIVQMSLAFVLSRYTSLGVNGVRWAIVISILVRAVFYPAYFKFGNWQKKKI